MDNRIMDNHIFIIAEAGVNHNGNPDMAFQLVDAAYDAGADAVKFQIFKTENMVTQKALKADYQKLYTSAAESQFSMLKRLELSNDVYYELLNYCNKKGIKFLSTAFDLESLDFLVNNLCIDTLKIPSGEITNGPLLLAHAVTGKSLIVSTGMATIEEIETALSVIAFGLTGTKVKPSKTAFQLAYHSESGQQLLKEKVTLLHCTTEYPALPEEINLRAIETMRDKFGLSVGYSDHSEGITVPIAAAALCVSLLEKPFTLDKTLSGPDHKASLEPDELRAMVSSVRTVEKIMGDGLKVPRSSELNNRDVARKSLVAAIDIQAGENFSKKNLTVKRPGTGRCPMDYWELLGEECRDSFMADEIIT